MHRACPRPLTASTVLGWPLRRSYRHATAHVGDQEVRWGERTLIMGVLNATPDSFSGHGVLDRPDLAVELATAMASVGADVVDVGGESTRPGAADVAPEEQIRRVVPIVAGIAAAVSVPVSIDTSSALVAAAALDAGAVMVNDVRGLRAEDLAALVAERDVPVVIMHNQRLQPSGDDVIGDVRQGFEAAIDRATAAGIGTHRLIVDPGFGFGWSTGQNLEMLRRLPELWYLGLPLLVGTSRKSTIGAALADPGGHPRPAAGRDWGTAATVAQAICAGVDVVRVHDVADMADVVAVTDAIVR